MKKTVAMILILCLSVCLLAACGSRAGEEPAAATDGNAAVDIPVDTPLPTDAPTPEPPVGNYTAAPEPETAVDATLTALLLSVRDTYHPGTAGSSMVTERIAAEILDWYAASGSVSIAYETAAALGDPGPDAEGNPYLEKLEAIYAAAIRLYGHYGCTALEAAGYPVDSWDYSVSYVKEVFDAIYSGFGQGAGLPPYVRIYRSDDNAMYFMTVCSRVEMLSPENLVQALVNNGVLAEGVALNSVEYTATGLHIDLNFAFQQQLYTMGTTGEYMLMGALVNTFLDNYGAEDILVTVDGSIVESGHMIYDLPMTFYSDNVSAG